MLSPPYSPAYHTHSTWLLRIVAEPSMLDTYLSSRMFSPCHPVPQRYPSGRAIPSASHYSYSRTPSSVTTNTRRDICLAHTPRIIAVYASRFVRSLAPFAILWPLRSSRVLLAILLPLSDTAWLRPPPYSMLEACEGAASLGPNDSSTTSSGAFPSHSAPA